MRGPAAQVDKSNKQHRNSRLKNLTKTAIHSLKLHHDDRSAQQRDQRLCAATGARPSRRRPLNVPALRCSGGGAMSGGGVGHGGLAERL
jgi:hypothetical protein